MRLRRTLWWLAATLAASCGPTESLTEYQGTLSGSATVDGVSSPTLSLGGVGIHIARQEGVVTRVELSSDCVVRVTASGGGLVPEPGQSCVAVIGREEPSSNPGIIRTSSTRVLCEPVTLSLTEHSPTRVSVSMLGRQTWTYAGNTSTRNVRVTFTPLGG